MRADCLTVGVWGRPCPVAAAWLPAGSVGAGARLASVYAGHHGRHCLHSFTGVASGACLRA
jgi:hypothetical protein